jgi:microcystin-dependent protein
LVQVTLSSLHIPSNNHARQARAAGGKSSRPAGAVLASPSGAELYIRDTPATQLSPSLIGPAGGSQPHDNRQPYLTINFIIALTGLFPTQS